MLRASFDSADNPANHERIVVGRTSMGRMGKPLDVVYATPYFAVHEADYVTGAVLYVDGSVARI